MPDPVLINIDGGIADVQLNRPDKLNALNQAMFDGIVNAAASLSDRKDIRSVVLSGAGRSFCAVLDFESFMALGAKGGQISGFDTTAENPANMFQRTGYDWKRLPVPVIAALHGHVYGGGLQIALGADIRIAAPDTRLSVMEIKWGLIPDMSATQTLRDLVRLDVAKELVFSGRIVEADEALHLGLITRIADDPKAVAIELATTIASKSPDAIRRGKLLLNTTWRQDEREGLLLEATLQKELIGSPNQLEAVMANMQKRNAEFQDPD